MAQIERALELDPLNSLFQALYGMDLMYARRYDDAIALLRNTLKTSPNDLVALSTLRSAFHMKHMYMEALDVWKASYAARGDQEAQDALARGYHGGWVSAAPCSVWRRCWLRARGKRMFRPGKLGHSIPAPGRTTKPSTGWRRLTKRMTRTCPI